MTQTRRTRLKTPTPDDRCWDCGSTIPGHHTPGCDLAQRTAIRDLPEVPGTQWWDREASRRAAGETDGSLEPVPGTTSEWRRPDPAAPATPPEGGPETPPTDRPTDDTGPTGRCDACGDLATRTPLTFTDATGAAAVAMVCDACRETEGVADALAR